MKTTPSVRARYLGAALLLFVASPAAAPAQTPVPAQAPGTPLPVDPALRAGRLPNGLRYYVRANRTPVGRVELRLAVNAGSMQEDDDQRGLAHFLEHMAFNGTTHFKEHQLINYLQSVGMQFGADLNAYTSYDETVYMLTLPTDSASTLAQGIQILEDWAHGITIDSAEVVAERGVVLEEWRQRGFSDTRGQKLRREVDSVSYNGARYIDRGPIGDPKRLKTARREELLRFYRDWYRPDLMAVVAVGDFDADSMVAAITRHFGRIANPASPRPRTREAIPDNAATAVKVVPLDGAGTMLRLTLREPARDRTTTAGFRAALVERLYLNLINQRLRALARRDDRPYLNAGMGAGSVAEGRTVYHELQVAGRRALVRAGFAAALTEVERVAQHGFTAAEVARETRTLLHELEADSAAATTTESATLAGAYVAHFLTPGAQLVPADRELALVRQLLPGVTAQEIAAPAARWRAARNRVVTGQIPGVARGVTAEALVAVLDSVARLRLEPWTGTIATPALVAAAPTAGRITRERVVPGVGVTEWTLSNGARVLLKPTRTAAGQVVIRGSSPGGLSLADDTLFVSALAATSVLQAGGLGTLTADELREALRDKDVRQFGATIGANEEELTAAGSRRDLETLFQLLHLQVTAPRVDSAAFETWKPGARAAFARSGGGLSGFLSRYMTLQHPRTRALTPDMVDSVDLQQAAAFYRGRFANAGDFTFAIVGDVTPQQVRPLVERWIASLPTTGRREQPRDLEIRPPTGVLEETFHVASEAKTITYINFAGPFRYSREREHQLEMLAAVLQIRLRERLREELGGTYGVSVAPYAVAAPYAQYQLQIQFASAPERAEELAAALFQVIDTLRAHGPTARELREVTEMARRSRERELASNGFWLAALVEHDRRGWPLAEIARVDRLNDAVTAASVQEAARALLDRRNYVHLTFRPRTDQGFDYGEGGDSH